LINALRSSNASPKLTTINPATEQVLNEYEINTDFLYAFAKELRKNKESLARTGTQEMGKAIKEAKSEVEKCAWAIEYYADHGKIFSTDEVVNTDARKSIITFRNSGWRF
jgi:hypothetical protein